MCACYVVCACVQMAVALGGRIAEELIFGENEITTGASGDFQQVGSNHCCSAVFLCWVFCVLLVVLDVEI